VPTPRQTDNFVTLVRLADLTAARLLCGRLDADGIETLLPDEHVASQGWHLHGAIGGIRVQVRHGDLDRAREILARAGDFMLDADLESEPHSESSRLGDSGDDDGTITDGDRAAYRSMRVALVSLWLFGLIHPYSLWLAVRALRRSDVTGWGRSRAVIGLFVSLVGCAWMTLVLFRLLRWVA
jgi:hypothetical protein